MPCQGSKVAPGPGQVQGTLEARPSGFQVGPYGTDPAASGLAPSAKRRSYRGQNYFRKGSGKLVSFLIFCSIWQLGKN